MVLHLCLHPYKDQQYPSGHYHHGIKKTQHYHQVIHPPQNDPHQPAIQDPYHPTAKME